MIGHRAIYHDGWRAVCPVPGPSFAEAGMGFGEMVITEDKLRELDAKGWELYHVDEDFSETQEPRRRAPRQADRDDRALVRRGRQVQRAADRQPRHRAPRRGAAAARAAPQALRLLPAHVGRSRTRSRRASSTARTASPRRSRSTTAPRACWWRRGARRAATRSTSRTTSCTTRTTSSACSSSTSPPTRTIGDGKHELRFEFEPTGNRRPRTRQGDAGARAALRRRQAGRPGRPAGHHPARHRHHRGADRAGATRARR